MACGNLLADIYGSRRPTTRSSAAPRRPPPPAIRAAPPLSVGTGGEALESNERKMAERRHRAALDQAHAAVALGPLRQPLPAEFRPPAEAARERRKALLEQAPRPRLGAEMVDQDDLAAGLGDAGKLVKRRHRVGHRGDDVLRDHRVEEGIAKTEMLRVHHR